MAVQQVQATIDVKSENFHQLLEESILDSSVTNQSSSYKGLIAANERLKANISKIFTEFVNKARLEQDANADDKKKRKINHDDENEDEEDGNDDGSSDNNEEEEEEEQ